MERYRKVDGMLTDFVLTGFNANDDAHHFQTSEVVADSKQQRNEGCPL